MKHYLVALCCFFLFPLLASDFTRDCMVPDSLASTEGITSSIVNGSVSVISGDFITSDLDLVIPGAEPLVIQRSYCSRDSSNTHLHTSWHLNYPQDLYVKETHPKSHDITTIVCGDPSGSTLVYEKKFHNKAKQKKVFALFPEVLKGMTNCASQEISARTNLKNRQLIWQHEKDIFDIEDGVGSKRHFELAYEGKKQQYFTMLWEKKRNGNQLHFKYTKKHPYLTQIQSMDVNGNEYGSITIHGADHAPKKKKPAFMEYVAQDGRKITYKFEHFSNGSDNKDYLTEVYRPHAPKVTYEYCEKESQSGGSQISCVRKGRWFLQNEYYHAGKNPVLACTDDDDDDEDDEIIKIDKFDSKRLDRVKFQYAPLGIDSTPIKAFTYIYKVKESWPDTYGTTKVYNALMHRTDYEYNREHHLLHVHYFRNSHSKDVPYSTEFYLWGRGETDSNLLGHLFKDNHNRIIKARKFEYDAKGNIKVERFFGNISGKRDHSITTDKQQLPVKDGYSDHYTIRRKFDEDNRLVAETQTNGLKQEYTYWGNTHQLEAKVEHGSGLRRRHIFKYDAFGNENEHIVEDLNTGKFISKVTVPKAQAPAMGLPEYVYQYGTHVFLGKKQYLYTAEGWLHREIVYDANDVVCFSTTRLYDKFGNVCEETDPHSQTETRLYDECNNLVWEQGKRKDSYKEHIYDCCNRLIKTLEWHGSNVLITEHKYDWLSNRVYTKDPFDNETNYFYNEAGQVIKEIGPLTLTPCGFTRPETHYDYDALGNITKIIDPLGRVTSKSYNVHGNPTHIVYPDGSSEHFEYHSDGTLALSIGKNGLKTKYTRDCLGRELVKEEIAPDGTQVSLLVSTYDAFNLTMQTTLSGHTTYFHYDNANRLCEKLLNDQRITYTYDSLGRLEKTCEWFGEQEYTAKITTYNFLNQPIEERTETSEGQVLTFTAYTYDASGNKSHVYTNVEGNLADHYTLYDSYNKPLLVIDEGGNETHYAYDYNFINEHGQKVLKTTKTDPLGNLTISVFDPLGRIALIEQRNAYGIELSKRTCHYDLVGNLVKAIDTVISAESRKDIETSWEYDQMNRNVSIIEAVGAEQKQISTIYNLAGQKEKIVKPDGTLVLYHYDAKGRLQHHHASDHSFSYTYCYDLDDNLVQIEDHIQQTQTKRYYNENQRLAQEDFGNGLCMRYEYDRQGRAKKLILPDESSVCLKFDALYLREVSRHNAQDHCLYKHEYLEYDQSGNLLKAKLPNGTASYTYDLLRRPLTLTTPHWQEKLTAYDKVGNLLVTQVTDALGSYEGGYGYDDLYQLKSEKGAIEHQYSHDSLYNRVSKDKDKYTLNSLHQVLNDSKASYSYDPNGNLTCKEANGKKTHYHFDALDRLIGITTAEKVIKYTYDSFHRRLKAEHYTNNKRCKETKCLYQGDNEIGAYEEGHLKQFRVLGIGKGAEIGAAIALELQGKVYIPTHDHNGNVMSLTDLKNNIAEVYRYSAFGEEQIFDPYGSCLSKSKVDNPWRYASKRSDPDSQLIYFGRRYYDPSLGRWIAPDPLGFEAGPNLYAYVKNSPLTHFDLYGLESIRNSSITNQQSGDFSFLREIALTPGRALSFVGTHMMPVPLLQEPLCFSGHLLQGNSPTSYKSPFVGVRSFNSSLGLPDHPRKCTIFSNGILTSAAEAREHAMSISNAFEGANVHYSWNATHGFASDICESVLQKANLRTHSEKMLVKLIRKKINDVGGVDGGGVLFLIAHSQGGIITDNALRKLTQAERDMLSVYTFGTAKTIEPNLADSVTNYISTKDGFCHLMNSEGCKKGYQGYPHIKMLNSKENSNFAHGFSCQTYQEALFKYVSYDYIHYGENK